MTQSGHGQPVLNVRFLGQEGARTRSTSVVSSLAEFRLLHGNSYFSRERDEGCGEQSKRQCEKDGCSWLMPRTHVRSAESDDHKNACNYAAANRPINCSID